MIKEVRTFALGLALGAAFTFGCSSSDSSVLSPYETRGGEVWVSCLRSRHVVSWLFKQVGEFPQKSKKAKKEPKFLKYSSKNVWCIYILRLKKYSIRDAANANMATRRYKGAKGKGEEKIRAEHRQEIWNSAITQILKRGGNMLLKKNIAGWYGIGWDLRLWLSLWSGRLGFWRRSIIIRLLGALRLRVENRLFGTQDTSEK